MKMNTSSIGRPERLLMSLVERMRKDKLLSFTTNITVPTRDGKSFMLIKPIRFQERASILNLVCIETDHSISDLDSQCKELLNAKEPPMSS